MNRFQKWLPAVFGLLIAFLLGLGIFSWIRNNAEKPSSVETAVPVVTGSPASPISPIPTESPVALASGLPSPGPAPILSAAPAPTGKADLTIDTNGLSKATVVVNTTQGVIKFKLYPQDAPNTVNRFVELAQKNFYNGLTFHRAIENFIVQTGDPTGSGNGGSGQHLKAEFNSRRHLEGTVAMARAPSDPNSADSQFYITVSPQPRLDHNYTVFGQVIDGMDVVRKIKVGDKINTLVIE